MSKNISRVRKNLDHQKSIFDSLMIVMERSRPGNGNMRRRLANAKKIINNEAKKSKN
jgi:hypothetical protein